MVQRKMDKLSFLHLTTFLQGGAGKILCSLAVKQKAMGAHVIVVGDGSPCEGYEDYLEYVKLLQTEGIPRLAVHSLFRRSFPDNLQAAIEIKKIMVQENINIVHANAAIPALVGLIARSALPVKIPVVLSMQGWGTNKTIEQERTDIAIINLIDAVFPVSLAAKKLLIQKGAMNDRMVTIPNGIDIKSSSTIDDDLSIHLCDWSRKGVRIIGCIGTICPRKDQAVVIRAIACEDLKNTKVIFIGEGNTKELSNLALELGLSKNIVFAGYRHGADRYISNFDVLVLASRSEGLPLVILEAFRERIPVVGSDIPEIREVVKEDVTGHLFQPGDAYDLRRKLLGVLNEYPSHRQKRCKSAYALFLQKYTTDKMYQNYLDQYVRLLQLQ